MYNIIYADPPWMYTDKIAKRGAEANYLCMTMDELKALPVYDIAADDCLLAMWWTGPMAREAIELVDAWGFEFKNMTGFTWAKRTKLWKWHFGMGRLTRGNTESVLFATKGKPKRISASVSQLVEAPYQGHSVKPDEVAHRLVELMGDVPRLEMFARRQLPGWDVFGHIEGSIVL